MFELPNDIAALIVVLAGLIFFVFASVRIVRQPPRGMKFWRQSCPEGLGRNRARMTALAVRAAEAR